MPGLSAEDGQPSAEFRHGFLLGEWTVSPMDGRLQSGGEQKRLQPKTMDVLLALARARGQVVEREQLLRAVWGDRAVTDEPLTRCIADLRRALGDQRDRPVFIETIPKRGYRLIEPVRSLASEQAPIQQAPTAASHAPAPRRLPRWPFAIGALTIVLATGLFSLVGTGDRAGTGSDDSGGTRREPPAIAVLPFLNLSANPTDAFMADGTAETLTHVLAHVDGLQVVARSSAFVFREAEDVRVIGQALDVDAVLEGSVQVLGDEMRITAQLVATDDGHHLWSGSYDRPALELFAVQEQIAGDVAAALQLTLLGEEVRRSQGNVDFEAYREYLLGMERLQERTADSILAAEKHFARAREQDDSFALAQVGYAEAISLQHYYLNRPIEEIKELALPAIDSALALDEGLGEAHAALGFILFNAGDLAGAEAALRRAIALSPNHARAWFGYGTLYNDTGHPEKALAMHRRALELNPLAPHINSAVGAAYEKLGWFDDAIAQLQRTMEIAPDYGAALYRLGALKWNVEGDAEAAIALYRKAIAADPGNPWAIAQLARLYLDLGGLEEARQLLWEAQTERESVASGEVRVLLLTMDGAEPDQRLALVDEVYDEALQFGFRSRLLRIARDAHLELGHPEAATAMIRQSHPELFSEQRAVDWVNFSTAVDLAYVLQLEGESEQADQLLTTVDTYIRRLPRLGCCGFGIADVEIAALRGDFDEAVALLENALAQGWKTDWQLETRFNPNLSALINHPKYLALLQATDRAMNERLQAVRSGL